MASLGLRVIPVSHIPSVAANGVISRAKQTDAVHGRVVHLFVFDIDIFILDLEGNGLALVIADFQRAWV